VRPCGPAEGAESVRPPRARQVLLSSVIYWVNPRRDTWRRTLDLVVVRGGMASQIGIGNPNPNPNPSPSPNPSPTSR